MDFSGAAPVVWPPDRITATDAIIDMSPGEIFEWTLGSGAPVFPERDVVSGIAIAIHVFDSDHNIDAMGQKIEDAAAAVKTDGSLADLLKQLASDPGGVAADVLLGAVAEVGKIVGAILKDNQDDNVAFFTGYYEVDKSWDGKLHQDARGASIDLGALPTP